MARILSKIGGSEGSVIAAEDQGGYPSIFAIDGDGGGEMKEMTATDGRLREVS
jgi:hypothetical protein